MVPGPPPIGPGTVATVDRANRSDIPSQPDHTIDGPIQSPEGGRPVHRGRPLGR